MSFQETRPYVVKRGWRRHLALLFTEKGSKSTDFLFITNLSAQLVCSVGWLFVLYNEHVCHERQKKSTTCVRPKREELLFSSTGSYYSGEWLGRFSRKDWGEEKIPFHQCQSSSSLSPYFFFIRDLVELLSRSKRNIVICLVEKYAFVRGISSADSYRQRENESKSERDEGVF